MSSPDLTVPDGSATVPRMPLSRDARLVFAAKTTRTFCYGALGVLIPVHLARMGLDARGLGRERTQDEEGREHA